MDEHRPAKHSVPSLYKTRLCRTYMEKGICPYGEKCDFAHGTSDLSYDITKHPKVNYHLCHGTRRVSFEMVEIISFNEIPHSIALF